MTRERPVSGRAERQHSLRPLLPSLVLGLLAMVITFGAGVFFVVQQDTQWTAESQLLLTPAVEGPGSTTSTYYDTLSSGQLPATAAAIVREPSLVGDILEDLELDRSSVSIMVTVVPETAVIRIEATAPTAATAEEVADALAASAVPDVNDLLRPFQLNPLGDAEGTATITSLGSQQLLAAVALAAVVVGISIQQVVHQLRRARPRVRR